MPGLDELIAILDLEEIDRNLFRGRQASDHRDRVFGGHVIAQALAAAYRTVEDRPVHSLHAYFIRPGDPKIPIIYQVDRLRDGRSFSVRRVLAIQNGDAIYTMAASFQVDEKGFEHQLAMPEVPPPEALVGEKDVLLRYGTMLPPGLQRFLAARRPVEIRAVDAEAMAARRMPGPWRHFWVRSAEPLPDRRMLHECMLAYTSDMALLDTALAVHGQTLFEGILQTASLDHALWFHRPFRIDDWLLYSQQSPSTSGARGLVTGTVFSRDGRLVASVAQEALMRPPAESR